jgi:hypothetical protein
MLMKSSNHDRACKKSQLHHPNDHPKNTAQLGLTSSRSPTVTHALISQFDFDVIDLAEFFRQFDPP